MFIKGVISFILSIVGLGSPSTQVYVATPTPIKTTIVATSTKSVNATTTKKNLGEISTTTKKIVSTTTPKKITKIEPKKDTKIEEKQKIPDYPLPDFEKVNTFARKALVNILCNTKGKDLSPISGTGVFINPKGIILTNAHIAQYFLLKDYKEKDHVSCVIRTGSPAYPTYNVELMYISPTWVKDNSRVLKSYDPKGTGENDFAFLRVTGTINGTELPVDFPFIIPDVREYIEKNEPVLLVSYPAGFLGGQSILQNLNIASSITSIQDFFTFKGNTVDLLSVGGTVVSQKGSSGGAVVDKYVSLLGIISTSSNADTTSERDLRAITLAHINRALQNEIGMNLPALLDQNSKEFAKTFASTTAPLLTKVITDVLTDGKP